MYKLKFIITKKFKNSTLGFTLIELLVVISIIGILAGIMLVAFGGVRAQGRDARRKTDLEQIRSGLELYKADCRKYPTTLSFGGSLTGDGSTTTCLVSNNYISGIPNDPQAPVYIYYYTGTTTTYTLCARLEAGGTSVSGCGSCGGAACNYKVTNP